MLFGTEGFEIQILELIQKVFGGRFFDFLMPHLTAVGNMGIIWILIGVLLLCIPKYRKDGVILLLGLLIGFLLGNVLLKNLVARPRPFVFKEDAMLLIKAPQDLSFPSGHTLSSFVATFSLYRTNKVFGRCALVLAVIIAFSRMYLFVHYPTDILGGILLAYFVSFICKRIEILWIKK